MPGMEPSEPKGMQDPRLRLPAEGMVPPPRPGMPPRPTPGRVAAMPNTDDRQPSRLNGMHPDRSNPERVLPEVPPLPPKNPVKLPAMLARLPRLPKPPAGRFWRIPLIEDMP